MKLSAAVILLAIGTVEAHTSTRRAHRRAQEVAAPDLHVAMVPDPDFELNADGGQYPGKVLENEEITYYDPIGDQTPFDIGEAVAGDYGSRRCQEEEVGGLVHISFTGGTIASSYGGFPSCTTPSANLSASRARQGAASTSIPAWSTRRRNQMLVAVVSIACSGIVPAIVEEWIQSCFVP